MFVVIHRGQTQRRIFEMLCKFVWKPLNRLSQSQSAEVHWSNLVLFLPSRPKLLQRKMMFRSNACCNYYKITFHLARERSHKYIQIIVSGNHESFCNHFGQDGSFHTCDGVSPRFNFSSRCPHPGHKTFSEPSSQPLSLTPVLLNDPSADWTDQQRCAGLKCRAGLL